MHVNVNEPVSERRNKRRVGNSDNAKRRRKTPANGNGKTNDVRRANVNGTSVSDGKKPSGGRRKKLPRNGNGNVKASGIAVRKSAKTKPPLPLPLPRLLLLHANTKSKRDANAKQTQQLLLRPHKRKRVARPKNVSARPRPHAQRKRPKRRKPNDKRRRNNKKPQQQPQLRPRQRQKLHNDDNVKKPLPRRKSVHVKRRKRKQKRKQKPQKKPNGDRRKMKSPRRDDASWNVASKKRRRMEPVWAAVRNSHVAVGVGRSMTNRPRSRPPPRRYHRRLLPLLRLRPQQRNGPCSTSPR